MPAGRPSKLTAAVIAKTKILAEKGLSDSQLCEVFEISVDTINEWKKNPKFSEVLKGGKANADERVVNSLYHRACGYSHPEDKIFNEKGTPLIVPTIKHYPPDTAAIIFWLKNRQPDKWRDKHDVDLGSETSTLIERLTKALERSG
jgi:hypothetical protein